MVIQPALAHVEEQVVNTDKAAQIEHQLTQDTSQKVLFNVLSRLAKRESGKHYDRLLAAYYNGQASVDMYLTMCRLALEHHLPDEATSMVQEAQQRLVLMTDERNSLLLCRGGGTCATSLLC